MNDQQWKMLRPKCRKAQPPPPGWIQEEWGKIAAEVVKDEPRADWRWLLADLRNRCIDNGINCPFSITHLVKFADSEQQS